MTHKIALAALTLLSGCGVIRQHQLEARLNADIYPGSGKEFPPLQPPVKWTGMWDKSGFGAENRQLPLLIAEEPSEISQIPIWLGFRTVEYRTRMGLEPRLGHTVNCRGRGTG
jgi:hypothetical protein